MRLVKGSYNWQNLPEASEVQEIISAKWRYTGIKTLKSQCTAFRLCRYVVKISSSMMNNLLLRSMISVELIMIQYVLSWWTDTPKSISLTQNLQTPTHNSLHIPKQTPTFTSQKTLHICLLTTTSTHFFKTSF